MYVQTESRFVSRFIATVMLFFEKGLVSLKFIRFFLGVTILKRLRTTILEQSKMMKLSSFL